MTNNENLAQTIGRYAGCECNLDNGNDWIAKDHKSYIIGQSCLENCEDIVIQLMGGTIQDFGKLYYVPVENVHPVLRTIDQITDEELAELLTILQDFDVRYRAFGVSALKMDLAKGLNTTYLAIAIDYLRSRGFDCDNLINRGIAIREKSE